MDWEDPLEKGMATHSSVLAWNIPWREELDGLQSMGSQRVGHDCVTNITYHAIKPIIIIIVITEPHCTWYKNVSFFLSL